MDATSPDITTAPEPEVQREAMKQMAQEVLAHARTVISSNHLDPEPNPETFAWQFFATDRSRGEPSYTALALEAFAKGEKPPSVDALERQLLGKLTPDVRKELERQRRAVAGSISILFKYTQDPKLRLGPHELTMSFLQGLGFNSDMNLSRDGRVFEVKHPTKPFIAECNPVGRGYEGEPKFDGLAIRYQSPQNQV